MALGNVLDNAPFRGFIGQLAGRPVADGAPRVRWGLTRQCHDLAPLFGTEGRGCPWTWRIL